MPRGTTIKKFIVDILIQQTQEIANLENGKYAYQAFALEAISIELLGKVLSGESLFEYSQGKPKIDFEKAIDTLFPEKYRQHKTLLYDKFRCGMLHAFGPKNEIVLGNKEIPGSYKHLDFSPKEGRLILFFEEFHKDFISAAHKLLSSSDSNTQDKLNEYFLYIGPVELI